MDRRQAFTEIAARASQGELAFPTHAEVALRIVRALDDPDASLESAAKLVATEPLLAARVVAIANSVTYNRSGREVTDVRTAVARLGFRTVRSLATALVTRNLAGEAISPAHRALAVQLWEHTAHVAALASVIARRVTHQDPETALFAGIVHEVGSFYVLSCARDYPGLLEGSPADWIETGEATINRAVLAALGVPDAVARAVDDLLLGYMAMPPTSLGDTLLLADELAPVASPLYEEAAAPLPADDAPPAGRPATGNIDAVIGEDTLQGILAESADEVRSLIGALRF